MTHPRRGPLDLLALTPLQRQVIVHLTREGPADASVLAQALNQDPAELRQTLAELAKMPRKESSPLKIMTQPGGPDPFSQGINSGNVGSMGPGGSVGP